MTDLDLLMQKGRRIFLVESKHYTTGMGDPIVIRSDADSLLQLRHYLESTFGSAVDVKPIFTFVSEPSTLLSKQLEHKGVQYLVGDAEYVAQVLSALN